MRDQARTQQFRTDDLLQAFANILLQYLKVFSRKRDGKIEITDRQHNEIKEELKDKTTKSREDRLRCFNCSAFGNRANECMYKTGTGKRIMFFLWK